ncbi:MAG: tRNA (N(6)-L-threonylcarbamoyladenosine(37)-C(2))-methylthiotransferase MtaB [Candidatus Rokubacteria bacterium]|nr:tRNA (N(6)-L-threonylcarbamoyladenosine(37)-C(2))-methylthiotransferase MtaB [Candidatus Rokubacteria bacterium]
MTTAATLRVAFTTLGCRLNQVDTQELQAQLEARGFVTVGDDGAADVVVVNSCTVTSRADFSDRQAIHRAVRRNPDARVIVTGCWAQTDPDTVARVGGVDLVVGNADKARLSEMVEALLGETNARPPAVAVSDIATARTLAVAPLAPARDRSRAFVKVQEGCQHRCAFCIVPRARGASRSRRLDDVVEQVEALVCAGHAEVVLTGVDLGHYGADLVPRTTLAALVRRLVEIRGLRWVRLSSVLPAYFTDELVDVVTASGRVAPHLHIPLQSGSPRVLRRMRRPYTVDRYRALVDRLTAAIPRLGLGADVIVGFPGETPADFDETRAVVADLPFTYLHVFPYSDRAGTEAAAMGDRVETRETTRRGRVLRALAAEKNAGFQRAMVGTVVEVLVLETPAEDGRRLVGLTGNYIEVAFAGAPALRRRIARVRVEGVTGKRAEGILVREGNE